MEQVRNQIAAMAAECRTIVREANENDPRLPKPLNPQHLLWMCSQISIHAYTWPVGRLQRWIGFIQAGILANRMLDLEGIKAMFDAVKRSVAADEDADLIDHLDLDNSFTLDLGGQG